MSLFCVAAVIFVAAASPSEQVGVTESTINVDDATTGNNADIETYDDSDNIFADSNVHSHHERRAHSSWRQSHGRRRRAKEDGVCELEIFCGNGRGEERTSSGVVRLPIRGQRGPPGPQGSQGEKGQKGQDGNGVAGVGQPAGA